LRAQNSNDTNVKAFANIKWCKCWYCGTWKRYEKDLNKNTPATTVRN